MRDVFELEWETRRVLQDQTTSHSELTKDTFALQAIGLRKPMSHCCPGARRHCLKSGQVHALLGENGGEIHAGPILAGAVYPDSGEMFLDGAPMPRNLMEARRSGRHSLPGTQPCSKSTVAQNLLLPSYRKLARGSSLERHKPGEKILARHG